MASTFTTNLRLELQGSGENRASWGSRANTVFTLIDEAIAAKAEVTVPDNPTPYDLTHLASLSDESRKMMLRINGALTADRTVQTQPVSKTYLVNNNTTGGKNIIFKTTTGSNSVSLAPGVWKFVFTDGDKTYTNDSLVTFSSAAQRWGVTSVVDDTGKMEIGRYLDFHNANADATDYAVRLDSGGSTTDIYVTPSTGTPPLVGGKVWSANNMGHGSGMNADLLDGKHAAEVYTDAPNDGKLYARRVTGGVGAWVEIAPFFIEAGTGHVILKFGAAAVVVRIRTDGFIRTASDVQIYSTTVAAGP